MSNLKMTEAAIAFYIFDDLNRIIDIIKLKQETFNGTLRQCDCKSNGKKCLKKFRAVYEVDGYFVSEFIKLLNTSEVFYNKVVNNFLNAVKYIHDDGEVRVKFQLIKPKLEVIDYKWNDRICNLLVERQDLEHAMSWLSTFGGAFSALGDCFENCAKVAGKISIKQFKIAFKLGEPALVARCRLYMALSLIQLGKLVSARHLVEEQYQLAKNLNDVRLKNMCHGVWSKLQYVQKQKKMQKKNVL